MPPQPASAHPSLYSHGRSLLFQMGAALVCAIPFGLAAVPEYYAPEAMRKNAIEAAIVLASGLSFLLAAQFVQYVVGDAAHESFERGEVPDPGKDRRWPFRVDRVLLERVLARIIVLPALMIGAAVLLRGPLESQAIVGGVVAVALLTIMLALALCTTIDHRMSGIGQPFAGQSAIHMVVLGVVYVFGILAVVMLIATQRDQLHTGGLVAVHLAATAIVTLAMLAQARYHPKWRGTGERVSTPGRRSQRLFGAIGPPLLLIGANMSVSRLFVGPGGSAWLGTGWMLSVAPLLVAVPFIRIVHFTALKEDYSLKLLHADVIRGTLLLGGIVERHLPFFLVSLPFSVLLAGTTIPPGNTSFDLERFEIWLAATLVWMAPFLLGLLFLEETFESIYTTQMRRCILRVREHVLIFGYGDLGRRFVRDLLGVGVVSYNTQHEHLAYAWNILLPNGDLAKVLTRMVAVEINASHVEGVVRPPGHAPLGYASVTRIIQEMAAEERAARQGVENAEKDGASADEEDKGQPPPLEYVIPAVVGDAASEEIQNVARLQRAKFVACLLRQPHAAERAQSVFHRIEKLAARGTKIPTVLAVHSSTYPPYITERVISNGLPVHYIFPEQLEGLNTANLVYALYRRAIENWKEGEPPPQLQPVVICGRGKRIFYLIDSFLQSMGHFEYQRFAVLQHSSPFLILMTTEQPFTIRSRELKGEYVTWPVRRRLQVDNGLQLLQFSRHISRSPKYNGQDGDVERPVAGPSIDVPILRCDARDYESIRSVLNLVSPSAVVVSDHEADDEFHSINTIAAVVSRNFSETSAQGPAREAPLLLVSGETGKRYLAANFQKALAYYEGVWCGIALTSRVRQPGLYPNAQMRTVRGPRFQLEGDPLIDVLEDPVERLVGIARSYIGRAKTERTAELNVCVSDNTGSLGSNLAGLTGLAPLPPTENYPILFTNSRFVARSKERFVFRSFVEIHGTPPESSPDFARLSMVARGERPARDGKAGDGLHVWRDVAPLIASKCLIKEAAHLAADSDEYTGQAAECCGMPTCPVESFNKVGLPVMRKGAARSGDRQTQMQTQQISRQFVPGKWKGHSHKTDGTQPFAYLKVECEHVDRSGSAAVAINALMLRSVRPIENLEQSVFNLTYIATHECHDERFGVFTCYGFSTDAAPVELSVADVVAAVEIRPVTHKELWSGYADALVRFLGQEYERDPRTEPNAIVIGKKRGRQKDESPDARHARTGALV